jgi:hypothetical protein
MVYDVVASRQRRYAPRVLGMVETCQGSPAASSLLQLAHARTDLEVGLRRTEADTMRQVAVG